MFVTAITCYCLLNVITTCIIDHVTRHVIAIFQISAHKWNIVHVPSTFWRLQIGLVVTSSSLQIVIKLEY